MRVYFGEKTLRFIFLGFMVSLLMGLIQLSWGVGFLLGFSVMLLNLMLVERHVDQILFRLKSSILANLSFYTLANALLAIPLLLSVLYPEKSNIFAAAAGLLFYKYMFYIKEIFFKKESTE